MGDLAGDRHVLASGLALRNIETIYGSDLNGLVWAYRFSPDTIASTITSEEVLGLLESPAFSQSQEFLWLHFSLANSSTEPWLQRHLGLPAAFFDSIHSQAGSTRIEVDSESLVATIHDVQFDFSFDVSSVTKAFLFVGPRILVSVRLRPLRSIDQLRSAVRNQKCFRSSAHLLAHLLSDQAGVLVSIVRDTTAHVDQIEDRLLANRLAASRSELGTLRRVLVRLQRLLAPEPAALFRLLRQPPEWILEADVQDLQQSAEEFSAALGDTTALVERLKLLQEELGALVNEQTNRTLFILTLVTVLALPINLMAGLFGMNVGGIPLAENQHGFLMVIGGLMIVTGLLAYSYLINRRD